MSTFRKFILNRIASLDTSIGINYLFNLLIKKNLPIISLAITRRQEQSSKKKISTIHHLFHSQTRDLVYVEVFWSFSPSVSEVLEVENVLDQLSKI